MKRKIAPQVLLHRNILTRWLLLAGLLAVGLPTVTQAAQLDIPILYLKLQPERPAVLSNLVKWPEDEGDRGADLGVADNNTTGKFLKQTYSLTRIVEPIGGDPVAAARKALAGGGRLAILNVPGSALQEIAALEEAKDDLLFNVSSTSTALRGRECHSNMLHTIPSRAMFADAIMQFLTKRKWPSIFLIEGNRLGDAAYANALRRAARKFRMKISHDKKWIADADMRRNASTEVPVFTQARSYDVVLVADEAQDFSPFIQFNTWLPRPVMGSAGLRPVTWDRVVEQWGAAQLQSRFFKLSQRVMTGVDYAAWAAARSIGEAVTRTKSTDPSVLRSYMLGDKFSLGGFKGTKLSYRKWNGQLRQAIPLVHSDAVVALAPLEGFLHKRTELDTLGLDAPESKCTAMK